MNWRRWNRALHRDLGYLCFGLTLVYAVSGVALNHVHHWNPNYRIERTEMRVGALSGVPPETQAQEVLLRLGLDAPVKGVFRPDPDSLQVFLEGELLRVRLASGVVERETVADRQLLRPMNVLHLNVPKRAWTWVADLYAVILAVVAVTGLLLGGGGLRGRRGWLTALGVAVPLAFLVFHYG